MKYQPITAPAFEPVTLAEAKLHCRVDISNDDAWFGVAIQAARQACETLAKRAFITQTWRLYLDGFPGQNSANDVFSFDETSLNGESWTGKQIQLPKAPLQSVTSITYLDVDGAYQTLAASEYLVDTASDPGEIVPAYGKEWPTTRSIKNAVTVVFVAGEDLSNIDARVKLAVLMLLAHWYDNRQTVVVGMVSNDMEFAVTTLMRQLWNGSIV